MGRKNSNQSLILRSAALGLAGAMRAWSPLALMALTYDSEPEESGYKDWPVFRSKLGRVALVSFGVGEYVADKWPRTIDRTRPAPQPSHIDGGIAFRTGFATVAGAALGSQYQEENATGVGAAVATGTAFVANYVLEEFRRKLVDWSGLHDYTIAMMEDQICVGICAAIARTAPRAHVDNAESTTHDHQPQTTTERSKEYAHS